MELETLLVEQNSIRFKITKVMKELIEWFKSKISSINEFLREFKNKISNIFKKSKSNKDVINKDIIHDGKVLFEKGTPVSTVMNSINSDMSTVSNIANRTINDCKEGITCINSHKVEAAADKKKNVIANIKKITLITGAIFNYRRSYHK